jgi:hypothetical protein
MGRQQEPLVKTWPCEGCADADTSACWCRDFCAAEAAAILARSFIESFEQLRSLSCLTDKESLDLALGYGDVLDDAIFDHRARFNSQELVARIAAIRKVTT